VRVVPFEEIEAIRCEAGVAVSALLRRLGVPRSTWYRWKAGQQAGRAVRRWPTPVLDEISPIADELAHHYSAWGHRKIWAMMRADGISVSAASVLRAMHRLDLVLPARYQAERRELAAARKKAFMELPTRRNRVWQMDFTEFETTAGGRWRICPVIDYATKTVLAAPVTSTSTSRDAVAALSAAIERAEELLGGSLLEDCVDMETGELFSLRVVTDNGAAFKGDGFARFFAGRVHLEHIRTRHYAPQTNGVVERFNQSLKYEHLYRSEIDHPGELADEVKAFVELYNEVRPHEALNFRRPLDVYRSL
jgi:transposase InsO family protein